MKTKKLAVIGITAALYFVLTIALAPISFGGIQLRLSEVLNLLAFIDPVYGIGVTLGCFIANLFSPFGVIDVIVGTFCTGLGVLLICRVKNIFLASLMPTLTNSLVGIEISVLSGYAFVWQYGLQVLLVMAGEFITVTCIALPIFYFLMKNKSLLRMLKFYD